jgi:NAD(P)-dependent dehydrogenase (short-subunit alcohol dehydrogenase family)
MNKPQRVVVTGANSGIGLALIEQSIERGDDIVAVDLKTDTLTLRYSHRANLHNTQLDLSKPEGIDTLFDFLNIGGIVIFFSPTRALRITKTLPTKLCLIGKGMKKYSL